MDWIDEDVRRRWGIKSAVRVLGIVTDGSDVEPIGDLRNRPIDDLFGVSQVLAWVAGQRADLAEDLEWRSAVPDLMDKLAKRTNR